MILCGIFNIFRKNNNCNTTANNSTLIGSYDIILNELNCKVEIAEKNYSIKRNTENMLKCINAVNMRNNYIKNNNAKININEDIDLT